MPFITKAYSIIMEMIYKDGETKIITNVKKRFSSQYGLPLL